MSELFKTLEQSGNLKDTKEGLRKIGDIDSLLNCVETCTNDNLQISNKIDNEVFTEEFKFFIDKLNNSEALLGICNIFDKDLVQKTQQTA